MGDPQGLVKRFHAAVANPVQRAIVRGIETAYTASHEAAKRELDPSMVMQGWGYIRWLKIDSELLAVGERFGKVAKFKQNTAATHIGHTELHFGEFVLTAACVQSKGRRPKQATYRELLAASNQQTLFDEFRERIEQSNAKNKIWAAILHVPNIASHTPLHIHVGFFAKDYSLAAPLIDLRTKAVDAATPAVSPTLRLRKDTGA